MRILPLLFFLVLASCGDSTEPEVIDLSDVLPSSERYAEGDTLQKEEPKSYYFDALSEEAKLMLDTLGFAPETVDSVPEMWFPDRFKNRSIEKWTGFIQELPAKGGVYTFSDSVMMKNTLFNWLDCFGKACNSLLLFEEKKLIRNSFVLLATEKRIMYLESEGNIDAEEILDNLQRVQPKGLPLYVITQNARQKTTWWKREGKKWIIIEKEEV